MSRRGRRGKQARDDGWGNWGGYMNAKKQKLQDQFTEETPAQLKKEGSGSNIFHGITIHVNGYTEPSSDELKRLMQLHGGSYQHYLRRTLVSHVIATNLPASKIRELKGLKVVRPAWITDSITAGKLLSYTDYQLYTAQTGRQQGLQGFAVRQSENQSTSAVQEENQSENILNQSEKNVPENGDKIENRYKNMSINRDMKTVFDKTSICTVDKNSHGAKTVDNVSGKCVNVSVRDLSVPELNNNPINDRHKNLPNRSDIDVATSGALTSNKENRSPAKAGDPKFLTEFYTNSRLHHLSTWKAEFKSYVNDLQSKGGNFPGREQLRDLVQERERTVLSDRAQLTGKPKRCVMHIDMDCFFVSVGLRRRPDLKGKPVAVTHSKGKGATINPEADFNFEKQQWALKREQGGKKGKKSPAETPGLDLSFPDLSDSDDADDVTDTVTDDVINQARFTTSTESFHSMAEIASCSYEARQAGVRNGMFMGTAKKLCPDLCTIPYDFEGYKSVSRTLYDTVASFTHDIEAVSCDEMLVDCTDLLADTGATPLMFSSLLRQQIFSRTDCPASAGISSNILLAKMATRKAKPNGQYYLTEGEVDEFIKDQSIKDIPGVGWSITKRFEKMGIFTCGDLHKVSMDTLQRDFGPKTGQSLYRYCRGQDDRPIKMEQQRKSVSAEVNYGIRFETAGEATSFIQELADEVCSRLKNIGMKGKTITLKLMVRRQDAPKETSKFMGHGICNNFSKSVTVPLATDDAGIVGKECLGLLKLNRAAPEDLRGIGIQIQKLEPAVVGSMYTKSKGQSILNFAVNKSTAVDKNASEKMKIIQSEGRLKAGHSEIFSDDNQSENVMVRDQSESVFHNLEEAKTDLQQLIREDGCSSPVNLLEEIAWRQVSPSKLPPLPVLPDLNCGVVERPTDVQRVAVHSTYTHTDDYFPSPSQVDPEVLNELPKEIRDQIKNEIQNRKNKKQRGADTNPATSKPSGPGCSHWQQDKGDNSVIPGVQIVKHDANNKVIEALPSPSQIDPSCLSALPESLQLELKEAYAKQKTNVKLGESRTGMMNLQQIGSPTKSPSKTSFKRSPAKKSPQFKIPRGKPTTKSRRKATSKKLLFKDQSSSDKQEPWNTRNTIPDSDQVLTEETSQHRKDMKQISVTGLQNIENSGIPLDSESDMTVTQSDNNDVVVNQSENIIETETGSDVNLCGAADLGSVRALIKEWIYSTTEPQTVDEEILTSYLDNLILDQNLEQVDLVLKFLYRNIKHTENSNWITALRNIFTHTEATVQEIYGSSLRSISV